MSRFAKLFLFLILPITGTVLTFYQYPAAIAQMLIGNKNAQVESNIPYGDNKRQTYDLYYPANVAKNAPLLVFFYGGGWSMGSKDLYSPMGHAFAAQGMIVAIPNYRLYPEVVFPGFVEDGARAISAILKKTQDKFGKTHPMILMGHSAGAHIATLLALDTNYLQKASVDANTIKAVVGLSGPYNFLPLHEQKYKKIFPEPVRAASQPINFVRADAPAMLLLTGGNDRVVRPANSTRLAEKIKAAGGEAVVKIYPGFGHTDILFGLAEHWPVKTPPTKRDVLDFIKAQMNN